MLIGHTTVVVSEQVEGEAPESDCTMENGKCVNPDIEPSVPVTTKEDPNCPSREHVIRCAGLHLDTNKNGLLERAELQSAIDRLPWYGRGESERHFKQKGRCFKSSLYVLTYFCTIGIIKILGSIDKMMSKCKSTV